MLKSEIQFGFGGGFGGDDAEEVQEAIHYALDGSKYPRNFIDLIEDQSEHNYNAENTLCLLFDLHCEDGVIRLGYYRDGANIIIDDCTGIEDVAEWADNWDSEGVLPEYLKK
jgi:hypothetical protein